MVEEQSDGAAMFEVPSREWDASRRAGKIMRDAGLFDQSSQMLGYANECESFCALWASGEALGAAGPVWLVDMGRLRFEGMEQCLEMAQEVQRVSNFAIQAGQGAKKALEALSYEGLIGEEEASLLGWISEAPDRWAPLSWLAGMAVEAASHARSSAAAAVDEPPAEASTPRRRSL